MTLRHLEIFLAVCEAKNMHAAAKKLHISQPSISQAILEIENQYQIKLFDRLNKRLFLTPIGEKMRIHALRIINDFNQLNDFLISNINIDYLRIGASVTVGTIILPKLLHKFKSLCPTLTYDIVVNNTTMIENLLVESKIDIALIEGTINHPDIITTDFYQDNLVIVARKDHPLTIKKTVTVSDIEQYCLITREEGSSARNQLEIYLQQIGIKLHSNYSASNTEAIKQALLYTDGIAILSKLLINEELKNQKLTIIEIKDLNLIRQFKIIYHKDKQLSQLMHTFIDLAIHND